MTDTNQKFRALFLTAIMVLSVVAMTVSLSGSAAAVNPTRGNTGGSDPAVVYLGEESVDITGAIGAGDPVTLVGTAGEADGDVVDVDADAAAITESNGFTTGAYETSNDGDDGIDISVRRGDVSDVTLTSENGADVTGGTATPDTNVSVGADFNFDSASYTEVTVTDSDGLEVTDSVVEGSGASSVVIENSTDTLTLLGSELSPGTYTVEVAGTNDGDAQFGYASQSVEFTVASTAASIDLDQTEVTQGERIIATVTGTPGEDVTVAVDADDLTSSGSVDGLYADTADVINQSVDDGSAAAVLSLGDDGQAQFRILTSNLKPGQTSTFEVRAGGSATDPDTDGAADASADLTVNARSVSISAPNNVIVGETFHITGTAVQASEVHAYVRQGDDWVALNDSDDNPAVDSNIESDGSYDITVSTDKMAIPDNYQVGVVAATADVSDEITREQFNDHVSARTSISTQAGSLTASLSETRIAVEDSVTIDGTAIGQGDDVRVYVVGPRGDTATTATNVNADDEFSTAYGDDFGSFDDTGSHTVIVVGAGRDGDFNAANLNDPIESNSLPEEQVELIEEAYTGAGVDDTMQKLTFVGESPSLEVSPIGTNGQAEPGELTISGTSNRIDGTDVFVDVQTQDGDVLASATGTINGTTDEWSTTVDLSDVQTGQTLIVQASAGDVSDSQEFEVVDQVTTPTTTAPPTTTTEPPTTTTEPPTTTAPPTTTTEPPTETTEPDDGQPGFGIGIAIVALLGAGLLALRRRD